jgi:hypothetical protein
MGKKILLAALLLPLVSCLHTKTGTPYFKRVTLSIVSGNAVLQIYGRVYEDLYYGGSIFDDAAKDRPPRANPVVPEGAVTVHEERYLSTNETYTRSLPPAEVLTVTVRSLDNNDVVVTAREGGSQREYTVDGANRLGLTISFQNR